MTNLKWVSVELSMGRIGPGFEKCQAIQILGRRWTDIRPPGPNPITIIFVEIQAIYAFFAKGITDSALCYPCFRVTRSVYSDLFDVIIYAIARASYNWNLNCLMC